MEQARKLLELIEEYLRKNQRLKWSTQDWKRLAWKKFMGVVGDVNVSEITYMDCEDFIESMYENDLKPNAIKSYANAVHSILTWAWRRGYREGDPFFGLKLPKSPKFEIRFYSEAELSDMLEAAPTIRWRSMIMTAESAALRKSEVLHLTVRDIDFDKREIIVQSKKDTPETIAWSPKSYECRRVPLTNGLANLYAELIAELPPKQPYIHLTEKRYFELMQKKQNGTLSKRIKTRLDENFSKPFSRIKHSASIKDGTFHDLRRTCITRWVNSKELSWKEVQELAGHADIATTMLYVGVRADITQRARCVSEKIVI